MGWHHHGMYKLSVVILLGAVGAASADKKPNVSVMTPSIKGKLDAKELIAAVKAAKSKLVGCYSQVYSSGGDSNTTLTIGRDGTVSRVSLPDVPDDEIRWCLALAMSNLRLPIPVDGMPVEATFQLRVEGASASGAFASLTGTSDPNSGLGATDIYGGLLGDPVPSGPGWGITGTTGKKSKDPTVSLGQHVVTGDLDKAVIRRYVKRNIQKIRYCYEKQLLVKPALKGTVTAEFEISPDGKVQLSVAHGMDTEVEGCIAQVIKAIEFPKPKGGGMVAVKYPFTFVPAGAKQP